MHTALPTHSTDITTQPTPPPNPELDSSASSVVNVEGILVQEADADVDTIDDEDGNAVGYITADPGSKQNLRDQLRRTLSKRQSNTGGLGLGFVTNNAHTSHAQQQDITSKCVTQKRRHVDMHDMHEIPHDSGEGCDPLISFPADLPDSSCSISASLYPPREYFVLTDAGKPVFTR